MEQNLSFWLYILLLDQGKLYVGITSKTPEKRFIQHLNGYGARYTKKYKPDIFFDKNFLGELSWEEARRLESEKTRELMQIYGVNNVRGGGYTKVNDYSFSL